MDLLYISLLAIAISLDGFFVGVTYGIRKIRVALLPLCIISLVSGFVIMASMALGNTLLELITPRIAQLIGAVILIAVGVMVVRETYKSLMVRQEIYSGYDIVYATDQEDFPKQLLTWKIKPLGIIIQILQEPTKADFDFSGSISNFEAIFLGLALALDALGAGFGAALTGLNPIIIPVCVAITKFVFISTGNFLGSRFSSLLSTRTAYIPGFILILLGVLKLL